MISIVDYKIGNIGSLENMIKKVGGCSKLVSNSEEIKNATKLILSGVGSFDSAMQSLLDNNLIEALNYSVLERKIPILCICLGAQLTTKGSEEGKLPGLGWIDAYTYKFKFENSLNLKIPHMGWNTVNEVNENPILKNIKTPMRFYFIHSYYLKAENKENILCQTNFGFNFHSGLIKDNIFAVQFHPEKSHKYGMKLIENFINL